jgi:hypothetical protein
MTNYIAYILLVRIKSCELTAQFNVDLFERGSGETSDMLKEIARQIFVESESEPCGLKGCKMSIFVETDKQLSQTDSNNNNSESNRHAANYLATQFRFDPSCSLTTFELNLFLKSTGDETEETTSNSSSSSSSFATLTKRFLSRKSTDSSSSRTATLTKNSSQHADCTQSNNCIYLDPINFNLFKCKLY